MGTITCKYCGALVTGDVCNYCQQKVDSDSLNEYKELLESKDRYTSIREKIKHLKELSPEENRILINLFKNNMIDSTEIDYYPILFATLSGENIIDRECFEEFIKKTGEFLMKSFVAMSNSNENTDYIHTFVRTLDPRYNAMAKEHHFFCYDKETIDRLYRGDLAALVTFFHELNHGKFDLDMKTGKVDEKIITMIKERIISKVNPEYYTKNYKDILEEICAQNYAIGDVLSILDRIRIAAPEGFVTVQSSIYSRDFDNRNRVVTVDGKEEVKTVDEIFEQAIQLVPDKMIEFPQLNIEYINENGVIRKKNIDELTSDLNNEINPDKINYIQSLVDKMQSGMHM